MDMLSITSRPQHIASDGLPLPQEVGTAPFESTEVARQNLRRELGWKSLEQGDLSLAVVSQQFGDFLSVNYSISSGHILQRHHALNTRKIVHRCPGYEREEIALSTSINGSAVISHTTPSLREICIVCGKSVKEGLIFLCVCGEGGLNGIVIVFLAADSSNRGWRLQIYYRVYSLLYVASHSMCYDNFVCRYCAPHIPHHNSGAGPRTQDFSMSGSFTGGTENSSEIHQAGNKNKTVRLDISLSIKWWRGSETETVQWLRHFVRFVLILHGSR